MKSLASIARRILASEYFTLGLCCATFAIFAGLAPTFASPGNVWNILLACLPLLLLAIGQTLVLITGGIDLSAPAIVGLSSVAGALVMGGERGWLLGHPAATVVALAIMLAVGLFIGLFNGACIAQLRMPAFMVTLTTTMFFSGFAVWLAKSVTNSQSIYNLPGAFLAIGQLSWIALLLTVTATMLGHLLLTRTLWGRWFYAIGQNSTNSQISGVPVARVTLLAYALAGVFAASASVLLTARLETGSSAHGKTLLLDILGAAVIGGTSLSGGKGRISWTVLGVLFLSLLDNGLNLLNLSDFLITIIKGSVILAAALVDVSRTRLTQRT